MKNIYVHAENVPCNTFLISMREYWQLLDYETPSKVTVRNRSGNESCSFDQESYDKLVFLPVNRDKVRVGYEAII